MRPSDRGASHTEVAVRLTNGGWTKVTNAEVLGDGLLAVHPAFVGDLAKVFTGPAWTLSHLPTGCAVLRCDRREDCVKIGNELLERLTGDDLKRWKRRSPAAIAKTSASIIDWLRRCKKARKYVAFKRRSRR